MRIAEFKILKEGYDADVAKLQTELKQAGADLGPYGPNKDGVDGIIGPYTRRAAQKFPDISNKYKEVLARPDGPFANDVDVKAIQDPDFNKKLDKIAKALGVDSNDILAVIKHESRGNPAAVNKSSGATGLIQFMPNTAKQLGTTTSALQSMSAVDQLDYVYKFYKMVGVRPGMDAGDLYVATFMPAYLGHSDSTVLGKKGAGGFNGAVYAQNSGLDRDKNGEITIADIKNSVNRFV